MDRVKACEKWALLAFFDCVSTTPPPTPEKANHGPGNGLAEPVIARTTFVNGVNPFLISEKYQILSKFAIVELLQKEGNKTVQEMSKYFRRSQKDIKPLLMELIECNFISRKKVTGRAFRNIFIYGFLKEFSE